MKGKRSAPRPSVREWWFGLLFGQGRAADDWAQPFTVEAGSLKRAFELARVYNPSAHGWVCLGRVNQRDHEKCTNVDSGLVVRVTEIQQEKVR